MTGPYRKAKHSGSAMLQNHPEEQYLSLLRRLIDGGDHRIDRTGVGSWSLFGEILRFDLSDGQVPLLTTKRVYWRLALKEMLWFLTGSRSLETLLRQGVRIWSDWPLERYRLETHQPDYPQADFEEQILNDAEFSKRWGDLGPIYGVQWRSWPGEDGTSIDQVARLIETIRNDPGSRRMLFSGWNVAQLDQMALPPCHMTYQFHVAEGRLSCLLHQRSADVFLGVPFNLFSAAALTAMIAQQCDLKPGQLTWCGGDVHLYTNAEEQARIQLDREPRPLPKLHILRRPEDIDSYSIEDFAVEGYDPHPPIAAKVAV